MAQATIPTRDEIIGQDAAMLLLDTVAPAHVLFTGPPGTGKTMIAKYYASTVSERCGNPIIGTDADDKIRAIAKANCTIIIDEAHMMKRAEALYPMLDAEIDQGTLIEADENYNTTSTPYCKTFCFTTTDEGDMPYALVSRLVHVSLAPYTQGELARIGQQVGINLERDVLMELARFGRGSPRRTKMLCSVVQKLAWDHDQRSVKLAEVGIILRLLGYQEGLTQREVSLMKALEESHRSIAMLSAMLATGRNTIGMIESELVFAGLVEITSRGRSLTDEGREVLKRVK